MSIFSKQIHVNTSPGYEVIISHDVLKSCGEWLHYNLLSPCKIAVITDSNVSPLYLKTVTDSLTNWNFTVSTYIFQAGENSKNFDTLSNIVEFLAAEHLTRSDCVAALGGGVVGDMAGFAAACYLRGIRYVQMPTTMLAAVDSSVGGKTAIDLKAGKNLAGAFLQPSAVLCDLACLKTLPQSVLLGGTAEAVKTGVLCDETLFALFENGSLSNDPGEVIARCVAYKAGVVERDEREQGERKLLNLGHTVGHAIEKCSNYTIPHGQAVAAGLAIIARSAERLNWTLEPVADRITACLTELDLPVNTLYSAEALADAALSDKKRSGGEITLVIPEKIGLCTLKKIPVSKLLPVIKAGLGR